MRNYYRDIKELSHSDIERNYAQFVIDLLLKWEGIQFKKRNNIPINFIEFLILTALIPNKNNNNDPNINDGLWAYQYFLIHIGDRDLANNLEKIMRDRMGIEEWNEIKRQKVIVANKYKSDYEIERQNIGRETEKKSEAKINQLSFEFTKQENIEQKKDEHSESETANLEDEKFDMIKYLEKEKRIKYRKTFAWSFVSLLLMILFAAIIYFDYKDNVGELGLLIIISVVLLITLAYLIYKYLTKGKEISSQ
ncbi:MAG: hypothetical protein ACRENZ_09625 [Thermodesulfobacteriota bacterium]